MHQSINTPLFEFLTRIGIEGCSILSLGCASGKLEEILEKNYGCSVFGLDKSVEEVRETKKLITAAAVVDLERENISDVVRGKKFDIVLMADVLEHLRNPLDVLNQCPSLLLPNGHVIVSIPNIANWSIRLKLLFGQFEYADTGILDRTHVKFYTLKTAKELLHQAGFRITTIKYSTSLVNMLYSKIHQQNTSGSVSEQQSIIMKKSAVRQAVGWVVRKADDALTALFPCLFAQQFMFTAVLMHKRKL